MASRARARTPIKGKQAGGGKVATVTLDGVEYKVDPRSANGLERWRAKEALMARQLPTDDDELFGLALMWVIVLRSVPDLSIDDVLAIPMDDFGVGEADVDDPEA